MGLEQQLLHNSAKKAQGCLEFQGIPHRGAGRTRRLKVMVVAEIAEFPSYHPVLKVAGALILRDSALMSNAKAQVPSLPGNLLPKPDQAGHYAGNRLLTCPLSGKQMEIDASRQIEATFPRCNNCCG